MEGGTWCCYLQDGGFELGGLHREDQAEAEEGGLYLAQNRQLAVMEFL